jgi:uncharacterized membrane protein YwaF
MGPWPWYIGVGALVAIAFFLILDAPFQILRRSRKMDRTNAQGQM